MIVFTNRNLKLYFRNKGAVFFSLLAVFIIIGLYAVFLGDVWLNDSMGIEKQQLLMNNWLIAGILAVASATTTMGAFGIMVEDKEKKIYKDFYASPIKRASVTGGYLMSAFIIGVLMSLVALVIGQIFIITQSGELLGMEASIKVFGLILLNTMTNTAMVGFMVSFFSSQNSFSTASTIMGTLIGLLTGIYLPIGNLPEAVQYIVKLFPASYGAALFRQVMMEKPMGIAFAGVPIEKLDSFKESMGIIYRFGEYTITPFGSVAILMGTALVFYLLSVWNMSRKIN
ncbi:MAG: ABC transporter permease [Pelosinus sp.]|nr:ABC transporter permease [Pelosinus sp.]